MVSSVVLSTSCPTPRFPLEALDSLWQPLRVGQQHFDRHVVAHVHVLPPEHRPEASGRDELHHPVALGEHPPHHRFERVEGIAMTRLIAVRFRRLHDERLVGWRPGSSDRMVFRHEQRVARCGGCIE